MTDILTGLAALTRKEDIERVSKDYAARCGWVSTTGPGFRLAHEDDMAKGGLPGVPAAASLSHSPSWPALLVNRDLVAGPCFQGLVHREETAIDAIH